jgi:hypothetical protein
MLLRLPDAAEHRECPADRPEAERSLAVEFVGCFEGWSLITIACDQRPYWMLAEIAGVLGVDDRTRLLGALAERGITVCPEGAIVQLDGGDRREYSTDSSARTWCLSATTIADRSHCSGRWHRRVVPASTARSLAGWRIFAIKPCRSAWERATRIRATDLVDDAATIAGNRLEFERRCFEASVLERLLDRLEQAEVVDPELLAAHRVVASELALGAWLEDYELELAHGWATPTQIAER